MASFTKSVIDVASGNVVAERVCLDLRGVYMILVRVSFWYEFIPVSTRSSVFVFTIPVRVHSGSRTGTKRSYWYEIWPHSVPVSCKGSTCTRFRSGRRWVAELTGTGSECVSIVNDAPKWLVRTRAHKKLCVTPVKWLPCKHGTKLDFVPEWNSYRYHVNTPLVVVFSILCTKERKLSLAASQYSSGIVIGLERISSYVDLDLWTNPCSQW